MSFGTVLGTTEQIVSTIQGHGYGVPSSHRAEAWSLLAGSRLLLHLLQFYQITMPDETAVVFISDNAGLIKRLKGRAKYEVVYPNATLVPDWDLTEQIYDTMRKIHSNVNFEWVPGHQDRRVPIATLNTEARYNVQAHHLAIDHMHTDGKPILRSPLLPTTRCIFHIDDRTYNGQYISTVRDMYAKNQLRRYMTKRNSWPNHIFHEIDWTSIETASRLSTLPKARITKICYDLLPTRYRKSKTGSMVPANCQHCHAPETFLHLIRCPNYTRTTTDHCQTLTDAIAQLCHKEHTPETVTTVLTSIVKDWFNGAVPLHARDTPTSAHQAISHQNIIGWDAWLKGFFSSRWAHFIKREYEFATSKRYTKGPFLPKLVKLLWIQLSGFWDQYLTDTHQLDTTDTSPETVRELHEKIRSLHRLKHDVLAAHRTLYFHADLEHFLQHAKLNQLKTYVLNYERPILQSCAQAKLIYAASPRIFEIPGYVRLNPVHHRRTSQTRPAGENPLPHKHTKWKPGQQIIDRFRQFFTLKTNHTTS